MKSIHTLIPNHTLPLPFAALVLLALGFAAFAGCGKEKIVVTSTSATKTVKGDDVFDSALDNLNHLSEFGPDEILPQVVEKLNQAGAQSEAVPWQIDPMVSSFGSEQLQSMLNKMLLENDFDEFDGRFLREIIWLRDISSYVCQDQTDDLENAKSLFDWTVRNILLIEGREVDLKKSAPQTPWETLLLGRGRGIDRAWVFMLLARQKGLDVVALSLPNRRENGTYPFWLPALVHEGQLYLFESTLGLPVPGPGGQGVATLAQVVADDSLLKQFDTEKQKYPLTSQQAKNVIVQIESSPGYLAKRFRMFEARLSGNEKMVLTAQPSALEAKLKSMPQVASVKLWIWPIIVMIERSRKNPAAAEIALLKFPFKMELKTRKQIKHVKVWNEGDDAREREEFVEFIPEKRSMPLWAGRLRHFEGYFEQPKVEIQKDGANQPEQNVREGAKELYLAARAYALKPSAQQRAQLSKPEQNYYLKIEQDTTYWLGLINFEQKDYPTAIDFFTRSLKNWPRGVWSYGAGENLARCYEAIGQTDKAIELYNLVGGPAQFGCKIRARRLKEKQAEKRKSKVDGNNKTQDTNNKQ